MSPEVAIGAIGRVQVFLVDLLDNHLEMLSAAF
jgi:hypothetical protein